VGAGFDRGLGHLPVEVVGEGAHGGRHPLHGLAYGRLVVGVHPGQGEAVPDVRLEEPGDVVDVDVGEDHVVIGVRQQVVGTGRTLQPRTEHEHPHTPLLALK
jgi:hypothetical protein